MALPPNRYASDDPEYPFVGPNWKKYGGRISGYVYNPYTDRYEIDAATRKKQGQANGTIAADAKKQSLTQQLTPVALASLGSAAAGELGKQLVPALGSGLKGLFSLGSNDIAAPISLADSELSSALGNALPSISDYDTAVANVLDPGGASGGLIALGSDAGNVADLTAPTSMWDDLVSYLGF